MSNTIDRSQNTEQKILKKIEELGGDHTGVFGAKFVGGIHLQQVPDEIAPCIFDLLSVVPLHNISFLEIGSAAGGNAYAFNYFFGFDKMVLIDDNRHKKHSLRKEILKGINYVEYVGDSHSKQAVDFVEKTGMLFDILFIDGDHSYNGVKTDFELYCRFVKPYGFILFHDTIFVEPITRYMLELFKNKDISYYNQYTSKVHNKPLGITVWQKKGK